MYICIETTKEKPEALQCLTPHIMKWKEGVWLLDMQVTLSYWQRQADLLNISLVKLWRQVLGAAFGVPESDHGEKLLPISAPYRAVCASHPWQAILFLAYIKERRLKGLVFLSSSFGDQNYPKLSWSLWWRCVSELDETFDKTPVFKQMCLKFQRSIARLMIKSPWEMHRFNEASLYRRYGKRVTALWQWTCGQNPKSVSVPFPWKKWVFEVPPAVTRHLEFAIKVWDHMTEFIIEDLDKLTRLCHHQDRVVRLNWKLVLADDRIVDLPIIFRHPHHFHQEHGAHKTILKQANYHFFDLCKAEKEIVSWTWSVEEKVMLPEICLTLFEELMSSDSDLKDLIQLENELPVFLHRYKYRHDWVPDFSYCRWEDSEFRVQKTALEAIAKTYPLWILKEPKSLSGDAPKERLSFLARVGVKWWLGAGISERRDYYKSIDDWGKASWCFKNVQGWYAQGLFS